MVMEHLPREEGIAGGDGALRTRSVLERQGTLPCTHAGCGAATGLACAYVDRRSHRCGTAWCPEHRLAFGEDVYCRRHAGVVTALFQSDESLPTSFPEVDNRAPSLVAWVVRGIDADVWRLLLEELDDNTAGQLIAERVTLVFVGGIERRRAWERSWRLVDHTGIVRRVSVVVEEADDTEVIVKVDAHVAIRAVPPWIRHRRDHDHVDAETDERERAAFNRELITAVADAMGVERQRDADTWKR